MATDQNKKLIEQLFSEGISGKNPSIFEKIIAPNFKNHGIPDAKTGPAGFKEVIQQFRSAFPDMDIKIETIIADGDQVATRGYWTGTNKGSFMGIPASGKKVNVTYIDFWKIQNGKAVENWVQMDIPGLMQQIGAVPAEAAY